MKTSRAVSRIGLCLLCLLSTAATDDPPRVPFTMWTINMQGGRERSSVVNTIHDNFPNASTATLFGLQEVKAKLSSCPFGGINQTGRTLNGAECFAAMMTLRYHTEWGYAYGRTVYPGGVKARQGGGNIIGQDWELVKKTRFNIGKTRCCFRKCAFYRRYLLETLLRHKATNLRLRFYNTHFWPNEGYAWVRVEMARDVIRIMRNRAQPDELPPILVGDFNTSRRLDDGTYDDRSIIVLDGAFERPADIAYQECGGSPWTGIDMVFVGRSSTFPHALGGYRVKRRLHIDLPSFDYSDHPAVGVDLEADLEFDGLLYDGECDDVVVSPPPESFDPPPSFPECNCGQRQICCEPGVCVDQGRTCP